ncbi:MAG: hypothetical protein D6743_09785, partial [Calditrichaeota bacterium]
EGPVRMLRVVFPEGVALPPDEAVTRGLAAFESLLGLATAVVLSAISDEMYGRARIVFQRGGEPAQNAAIALLQHGVLEQATALCAVGFEHTVPAGCVGVGVGPIARAHKTFRVELRAAEAAGGDVDLIQVGAHVITAIKQIPSRKIDPLVSTTISMTSIQGMASSQERVDAVTFTGSVHSADESVFDALNGQMDRTISGIARSMGVAYEFEIRSGTPAVKCHAPLSHAIFRCASELLGGEKVFQFKHLPSAPPVGLRPYLEAVPGTLLLCNPQAGNAPFSTTTAPIVELFCQVAGSFLSGFCK